MKKFLLTFILITAVFVPVLVSGHGDSDGMMDNGMMGGNMMNQIYGFGGMYWFGWISTTLFWVLIILVIAALIKYLFKDKK